MLSVEMDSFKAGLGADVPFLDALSAPPACPWSGGAAGCGTAAGSMLVTAPGCHVGVLDPGFLHQSFPKAVFSLGPLAMHTHTVVLDG